MSELTWYHKEWKQWNDNGRPSSDIINLKSLILCNNQLTQIYVNNLTNLRELFLYDNKLTQVNVSNLTNLTIYLFIIIN